MWFEQVIGLKVLRSASSLTCRIPAGISEKLIFGFLIRALSKQSKDGGSGAFSFLTKQKIVRVPCLTKQSPNSKLCL